MSLGFVLNIHVLISGFREYHALPSQSTRSTMAPWEHPSSVNKVNTSDSLVLLFGYTNF
jgi:hypothetical protein